MPDTPINEHDVKGIEVVVSSPNVTSMTILYVIFALIAAGVIWAFFGKADVVISCPGEVGAFHEPRRVYSPVSGELVSLYFLEGESVSKDTIMARIKAPEAIIAATRAKSAAAELRVVKRDVALVPERRRLLNRQLDLLRKRAAYQRESVGDTEEQLKAFEEAQKLKTEIIQDRIKRADEAIERARKAYENYERMYKAGAVSKKEYEDQKLAWKIATEEGKTARLKASAEFSAALEDRRQRLIELDRKRNAILEIELQIRRLEDQIARMEQDAAQELELARVNMEAAQQVTFDDLDAENLLKISAPTDGIITRVAYTQTGDKVAAATPMFTINSPDDKCLIIRISDQDRAFVEPGMRVRIKVQAFPYMRFGFLDGRLQTISPTAQRRADGSRYYEGKVVFDRNDQGELQDYFRLQGEKRPVQFGMGASAEIVVDRRRLIEFALDPFRKVKP